MLLARHLPTGIELILHLRYVPAEVPVGLAAALPSHAAITGLALPPHPAVDARAGLTPTNQRDSTGSMICLIQLHSEMKSS
jgi:hypothetical protein